ncbi:MAG: DUF488 domain-containing protein [Thermoguttaceae bacterium]
MIASRMIWTIGHSNHDIATVVEMLQGEAIRQVVDVRRFPGSRRQPQFEREALAASLHGVGVRYYHFGALGGRRTIRLEDSPNTGWRSESFNAYADYMQTEEFQAALAELMILATRQRTAILCAEALPWRCHRQLIADALAARGWTVKHIFAAGRIQPHRITEFALVSGGQVTYPGDTLF